MLERWPPNTIHRMLDSLPSLVAAGDDAVQPGVAWLDAHPLARGELKVRQSRERLQVNRGLQATRRRAARRRAHLLGTGSSLTPAVSGGHVVLGVAAISVFADDDCSAQLTWRASPAEDLTIEVGAVVGRPPRRSPSSCSTKAAVAGPRRRAHRYFRGRRPSTPHGRPGPARW